MPGERKIMFHYKLRFVDFTVDFEMVDFAVDFEMLCYLDSSLVPMPCR
jgi:hypothetical protein